jgi:uncharacterized protein (TIGR03067 family)
MRTFLLIVLAAVLSVGADNPKEDQVKKELKGLEGTWRLVSFKVNGGLDRKELFEPLTITIRGNRIVCYFTERGGPKARLAIDASKKPKHFNLTWDKSPAMRGRKWLGIYELGGGRMKICYAMEGKRPNEFSPKGGTEDRPIYLAVWKRVKSQ